MMNPKFSSEALYILVLFRWMFPHEETCVLNFFSIYFQCFITHKCLNGIPLMIKVINLSHIGQESMSQLLFISFNVRFF